MRNNSGEYYSQTQLAAEKFEFNGIKLQIGKTSKINQNEFFSKLSENLDSRMFTTRAAHKTLQDKENDQNKKKYDNLIKNLQTFDMPQWFAD